MFRQYSAVIAASLLALLSIATDAVAQTSGDERATRRSIYWGASAGLNIGATAPLPIPKEVTKVHAWYPQTNGALSVWGVYRFGASAWGIQAGIESERKAFGATTSVDRLPIHLPGLGSAAKALTYTGYQNTEIQASYLTLPVLATWHLAQDRLRLQAGLYASLRLSGSFAVKIDGDGLLGSRPMAPGVIMRFDFSDYLRPYDVGLRLGADYFFSRNFGVSTRFSFAVHSALKPEFRAIDQQMHHMYAFVGVSYRWRH